MTPFPILAAAESAADAPTRVRFIAQFGLERSQNSKQHLATPQTFYPPYDSNARLGPKAGPLQVVRVTFERAIGARMLEAYSDREVVDPKVFDFSRVSCMFKPEDDIAEWLRRFQNAWIQNRVCPNPRMYEVSNSSWLREIGASPERFKYCLILGHDAYAEVIAKKWTWESEGAVR